jgi:hypothetical protein
MRLASFFFFLFAAPPADETKIDTSRASQSAGRVMSACQRIFISAHKTAHDTDSILNSGKTPILQGF